jgi:hypothetical protein
METVLEVRPVPRFTEIKRELAKSSNIWVAKFPHGVYVSRSAPAIVRVLGERGFRGWVSSIYRGSSRLCKAYRCKSVDEVNAALEGVQEATFVVVNPNNWLCEEKDAAIVSGDATD